MSKVTNKPAARTRKPRAKSDERIDHSALIAAFASAKGVDTVRAGKLMRGKLRANFARVAELDGEHYGPNGSVKREANDKRPWTTHSRAVARDVLGLEV